MKAVYTVEHEINVFYWNGGADPYTTPDCPMWLYEAMKKKKIRYNGIFIIEHKDHVKTLKEAGYVCIDKTGDIFFMTCDQFRKHCRAII